MDSTKRLETVPEKQAITGNWSLSQLFNINTTTLLKGKESVSLGPNYTAEFNKKVSKTKLHEGVIVISHKRDSNFSMNLWIKGGKVRSIEAYEQKETFGKQRVTKTGIVQNPLAGIGPSRKRAEATFREFANQGLLKKDALRILGIPEVQKPKQTKVAVH